jgi:hypothetical protein
LKESIKQQRENEKIARLLGLDPETVQSLRDTQTADEKIREAQAILLFVEKPDAFISKKCDTCHAQFLTTYQFVSVCSTPCRIAALEKVGITYNPLHTPEERWKRTQIPTEYSIPPKAVQLLLTMAQEQAALQVEDKNQISEPVEVLPSIVQLNSVPPKSPEPSPPSLDDLLSEDYVF